MYVCMYVCMYGFASLEKKRREEGEGGREKEMISIRDRVR